MAVTRKSEAEWKGNLKDGRGEMQLGSGAYKGAYSFQSRFEEGTGTNPEELIAAAHAGCFSMAFSHLLAEKGHKPQRVHTSASVKLEKQGEGFAITSIHLVTDAEVPGIDDSEFQSIAKMAKEGCPVSKALSAVPITMDATLEG